MNAKLHSWLILLILVAGCGGSSSPMQADDFALPGQTVIVGQDRGEQPSKVRLILELPGDEAEAGQSFTARIYLEGIANLKQASLRLQYSKGLLTPTAIRQGGMVPSSALFLSSTNASGPAYLQADPGIGVVPVAFTLLPGQASFSQLSGVLAEVEFTATQEIGDLLEHLQLQQSPEYLILGDAAGNPLAVEIEYREAGNV